MADRAAARGKRYAGIVRVSHMGKRKAGDEDVHADRDQISAIERWAKDHGARLDLLAPELDVSGGLPLERRPSLMRAIEGVESRQYDGVVVAYLSRFGRNLREQLRAWDRIEAAGGTVIVVQEGIDTSTASGRLHRNMLLSIAVHEREQHADRFEDLREWATGKGVWQRRQTPLGYRRDDTPSEGAPKGTRRLVPDERADDVRAVFADYDTGATVSDLARRLTMTPSGTRYLLRNRVYLGELRVGQHVNPSAHEAIVDVQTFERVQRRLSSNVRPGRSGRPIALLAGIARCASCGHLLSRGSAGGGMTYRCPGNHSGAPCPASAGINCERLDTYAAEVAVRELARLAVTGTEGSRVADAQAAVVAAEDEMRAFLAGVQAAGLDAGDFADALRSRKAAVDAAKLALDAEEATSALAPLHRRGNDVWGDLDPVERNTLLRSLFAAVVVAPVGRGRRVPVPERAAVLRFGANVHLPTHNGGDALGINPLPLASLPAEDVL